VNADIAETFLAKIDSQNQGDPSFSNFPDYEATVPIHRLGNVINPENRTFRMQLRIDNPGERFKPNMVASVSIQSFTAENAIVVPSILIKQDVQGHFVFVAQENENNEMIARKKYIERGKEGEGLTMIESGLKPGEMLIQRGHNQVGDGTLVRID
jgi:membrane fusion protein, multidrug efflux system